MKALSTDAAFWDDDVASCPPLGHGEVVDRHFHDHGQLVYAASGALVTVTEVGTWMAPANRVTWVPPYFAHSRRSYGETDARILRVPAELSARLPAQPSVFAVTPLLREAFLALVDEHLAREAAGDHERRAPATPRMTLLLDVVAEELTCAPEECLRLPEPGDDRLKAVTDLLHADPSNPATLAELGHATGASERTLSRLFSGELGMSFHQWRTLLRVQRALIDLSAGRSVTEISLRLGWANPTSFITAFTALVGQTPGRYQQAVAAAGPRDGRPSRRLAGDRHHLA